MGFIKTLKQGQHYADSWPQQPKLAMIFPENRIIRATRFACKFMPFIAVFSIVWQQFSAKSDPAALAIAVLTALLALCIPLQGLYWLGKRAATPLPSQSALHFARIYQRLQKLEVSLEPAPEKPTYQQLAEMLSKAERHLQADFWEEL
ncbi:terminus macrodomain insulation protein YfbV [Mesocricetibacter intestinalis]|uniref:terminus macrodomain insulation protein YfbV n=1 Tax=Mesocricetibacter intestinalis TaxID=1521930 RepID=UPI00105E84F4|nr:terminus macrodomain insulation protein YfbV [Mesocricetibacter intestinalis]